MLNPSADISLDSYLFFQFFIILAIQEPIPDLNTIKDPKDDSYRIFYYPGLFVYACAMLWQDLKIATTLRSVRTFFEKFWYAIPTNLFRTQFRPKYQTPKSFEFHIDSGPLFRTKISRSMI